MKAFRFKDKMEGFKDARRVGEAGRDVGVPERAVLHGLVRLVREGRARRKGVPRRLPNSRGLVLGSQILQVNMRLKALAEIYTMHSFELL